MSTRTTTPGVSRHKKRCNFAERLRIQNFTISFALYEIIWSTAERQWRAMFVQQRNGKFYLYLHRPLKETFALVDVSSPDKPVLLSRDALKEVPGSQLQPPASGSVLALTVMPEEGAARPASATLQLPTQTVQFVDMSNPKNGKTVKTFKGVTSLLPDDARKQLGLRGVGVDGVEGAEGICGKGGLLRSHGSPFLR